MKDITDLVVELEDIVLKQDTYKRRCARSTGILG